MKARQKRETKKHRLQQLLRLRFQKVVERLDTYFYGFRSQQTPAKVMPDIRVTGARAVAKYKAGYGVGGDSVWPWLKGIKGVGSRQSSLEGGVCVVQMRLDSARVLCRSCVLCRDNELGCILYPYLCPMFLNATISEEKRWERVPK